MSKKELKIQNKSYSEQLLEVATAYRASIRKVKPETDFETPNGKYKLWLNSNAPYIAIPVKCIELLGYCNELERSIFYELLVVHSQLSYSKNGLIEISYQTICNRLKVGRTQIHKAISTLSKLGLIRINRGRRGSAVGNLYLLTFLPDCLGNMPVADYKNVNLPKYKFDKSLSYHNRQRTYLQHHVKIRDLLGDSTDTSVRALTRIGKISQRWSKQTQQKSKKRG